tara:strand:- start:2176 stop:2451 length:276 start_codon:yes stop_codon:yes gene_type:complete
MEIISQETVERYNEVNGTNLTLKEAKLKILNDVANSYSGLADRVREIETEFLWKQSQNEMRESVGLITKEDYKELVRISYKGGFKELVIGK